MRYVLGIGIACLLALTPAAALADADPDAASGTVAFRAGAGSADVWLYNITTGTYLRVTDTPESEQGLAITGHRVYYRNIGTGPGGIDQLWGAPFGEAAIDFSSMNHPYVSDFGGSSKDLAFLGHSAVSCNPFGFCDNGHGRIYGVFGTDNGASFLSAEEPETVDTPTNGTCMAGPDFDEPWLVWLESNGSPAGSGVDCSGPKTLYAKSPLIPIAMVVADDVHDSFQVSGGRVAIVEGAPDNRELAVYDLASGTRSALPAAHSPRRVTDFRNGRIVYDGLGPSQSGFSERGTVYVYDTASGVETQVGGWDQDGGPSYNGRVCGDWVAYTPWWIADAVRVRNIATGAVRSVNAPSDPSEMAPPGQWPTRSTALGNCSEPEDEAPSPPVPEPPKPPEPVEPPTLKIRAIGDSVTAGFGYYADGTRVPKVEIQGDPLLGQRCRPPNPPDGRCQSPKVIAYPAQYAEMHDVRKVSPFYENHAVTGSTPEQWIEADQPFRALLERVVNDDPDITFVTLGANPMLTDFAFGVGQITCLRRDSTQQKSLSCVRNLMSRYKTVPRLARIYDRLLDATNNRVIAFLYHQTFPQTLPRDKADLLFTELNAAVATAISMVRRRRPSDAVRLRLVSPGSNFTNHGCKSSSPWVLDSDTCIHPNRAGHEQFALAADTMLARSAASQLPLPRTIRATTSLGKTVSISFKIPATSGTTVMVQSNNSSSASTASRILRAQISLRRVRPIDFSSQRVSTRGVASFKIRIAGRRPQALQRLRRLKMRLRILTVEPSGEARSSSLTLRSNAPR